MIFWITVKKLNEKRLKMLNEILECYMAGTYALPHEVFVLYNTRKLPVRCVDNAI